VLLVASFVVPGTAAVVIGCCVPALFAALWLALPLGRRERAESSPASSGGAVSPGG
jgi:hypothetical protein